MGTSGNGNGQGETRSQALSKESTERKLRVLTKATPSIVRSIADAVTIKDLDLFLVVLPDGSIPLEKPHGFGLYYGDCRVLNGYVIDIGGSTPTALATAAGQGYRAIFELTNQDQRLANDGLVPKETIGIAWERLLDGAALTLHDTMTFHSYGQAALSLPLSVSLLAEFEPLFAVRGLLPENPGCLHAPEWYDNTLRFRYEGADGVLRGLAVTFSRLPDATHGPSAQFDLLLRPGEDYRLGITLTVSEVGEGSRQALRASRQPAPAAARDRAQRTAETWLSQQTVVQSNSIVLEHAIERSLSDLRMLGSGRDTQVYFSAGIPWFATLFGRDSAITALQTLAYQPRIAANTLRLLAKYQGQKMDDWRDEQPGKILHERRTGELAKMGEIPYYPAYYGSVDATPLFLILVAEHAAWTGSLDIFHELRPNIEAALTWIDCYGDANGDGYVEYQSVATKGLVNQGWKDSGDAIVNADGSIARPPISLVEVQGYVYKAKRALAELYRRAGEGERADRLLAQAKELRQRFNRDFWLKDKGTFALALQEGGKPAEVVSSNPGQALWTEIVDPDKARRVVQTLMAEDMFSGWGIRTLSTRERSFNPIGYHLGTVWPHDNSIIAAGLRRYGFDAEALRVFEGILEAAIDFRYHRLPELFAGFSRLDYEVPVRYPVACHPQAWAAGSIPFLLTTMLGLVPAAFENVLHVVRPVLPPFVEQVSLKDLAVGAARVDLLFQRTRNGPKVSVTRLDGRLDVRVET